MAADEGSKEGEAKTVHPQTTSPPATPVKSEFIARPALVRSDSSKSVTKIQ